MKPVIGIGADLQKTSGKRERAVAYSTYIDSLRRAGAIAVVIPPQPENAAEIVEELDGILLAGGDDCDPALYGEERHPSVETMDTRRQDNELSLARAARDRGIPTLGICLGVQMMNIAAGGSLVQDIDSQMKTDIRHASEPEDRATHDVIIEKGTQLGSILGGGRELHVNSSHHQAIKRVGRGFRVTAHAPDGIVEGLEDPQHPFYVGVQWHPEDMPGENSASALFGAFVEAARKYAEAKRQTATEMSPAGVTRRNSG
ncbi:MAG TPA: gamma-glutamyl-gamma-aminobutyrate hydrolase family protein [Thermoanaerobaculia bacterium]|nr:gamma-glutamyl-gamma-aminobutyrate hydrolase family protein [Thermoanaerobaculia bacterium]